MDKINELLNRKNSLERRLENCRHNNQFLIEELRLAELELEELGEDRRKATIHRLTKEVLNNGLV